MVAQGSRCLGGVLLLSSLFSCGELPQKMDLSRIEKSTVLESTYLVNHVDKNYELKDLGDREFCRGAELGSCFTLLIQIPGHVLQTSVGLAALEVANADSNYHALLQRMCNEGLENSLPLMKSTAGKIFSRVTQARCLFQTLEDETSSFPQLARNEIGLQVRLVEFGLEGQASSSQPAFGRFEFKQSKLSTAFHDAHVYYPDNRGTMAWRPILGKKGWGFGRNYGVFPTVQTKVNFEKNLSFQFDAQNSIYYLNHVLGPVLDAARTGKGLGELGSKFLVMQNALKAIASGSNPVVPALVLIGFGVDAVKDMCSYGGADCTLKNNSQNLRDVINTSFMNGTPLLSETKATFMDGLKYMPAALLYGVVDNADTASLKWSFNVPY